MMEFISGRWNYTHCLWSTACQVSPFISYTIIHKHSFSEIHLEMIHKKSWWNANKKKQTKLIQLIYKKTHTQYYYYIQLRKQNLWIEFKAHNYYSNKKSNSNNKKNVHKLDLKYTIHYLLIIWHLVYFCVWFRFLYLFSSIHWQTFV